MAIVSCTACQKKLKVADASIGKKVKCSCGHVFVAEADGASAPAVAVDVAEKVIVACTECGSKLKVSTASLGKKMKCPKCASVFVASGEAPPKPVMAAPVLASPVEDEDDMMAFARGDVKDEEDAPPPKAKPKASKAPPPMVVDEDYEEDVPKANGKAEPKRPVPAKADAPKKYPSRILVNLFVFFVLFLFIGFFALVFLMMDEANLLEPPMTNRQYLESFGWPAKAPRAKGAAVIPPILNKKLPDKSIKPVDGPENKDPDKTDDARKEEKVGATHLRLEHLASLSRSAIIREVRTRQ